MLQRDHSSALSPPTAVVGSVILGGLLLCAGLAGANSYPEETPASVSGPTTLKPAEMESLLVRAELHLQRQQPGLALRLYRQVPVASPLKARAMLGEGCSLFAMGEYERSARALRTLQSRLDGGEDPLELLPTSLELLGQDYLFLGRTSQARQVFRELGKDYPPRRAYSTVMVARTHLLDGSYHTAFETVAPVLGEGRFSPAYDFALDLYWKLDARDQAKMSRLLEGFLSQIEKEYTGRG